MKRIYLFSILASVLLVLSACGNEWLDEMQPVTSAESETSLVTPTDADYALNGIYTVLRQYEYYGARFTYYADAKGEDMQARGDTKRTGKYYLFDHVAKNSPTNLWNYPYKVIRNANRILAFMDTYTEEDLTTQLKNIKGQALTMRAMGHFDLVKIYGMPYTKDNGASMGVPVVTKIVPSDYKPARNTVAEVYKQIIDDLKEGAGYISKTRTDGKLNLYANQLLLARAYLYMGDDDNAYKVATKLIKDSEATGKYRLFTTEEYATVWKEDTGVEYFYIIPNTAEEISDSKEFIGYLMHRSGYDDISLSTDFMNLIKEDKNDVRIKIIDQYKTDRDYLLKYVSPDYKYSNIPVLRLSEAYLIAAEAAAKLSDSENAAKYLNAIVSRANPAKSVAEADATLDRVLIERRKELVGEGHRFFDAMRNNQTIKRSGKSHVSSNLTPETKEYNWDFYKIVMPIPSGEINTNKNLTQNPGYGS